MRDQLTPISNAASIDLAFIDEDELDFNKLEEFFVKVTKPSTLINQALVKPNQQIHILCSLIRKILQESNIAFEVTTTSIARSYNAIHQLAIDYPNLKEESTQPDLLEKLTTIFRYEEASVRAREVYAVQTQALSSTAATILKLLESLLKRIEEEGADFAKKSVAFLFLTNRLVDEKWAELRTVYVRVRVAGGKVERLLLAASRVGIIVDWEGQDE